MERTIREFLDKLKDNGGWAELSGKGTSTETKDWVLRKTAEAVLMGDEIARLNNQINELQMEKARIISNLPEIREINNKLEDKILQTKSLEVLLDNTFGQLYAVIGAKLGDLRDKLELPKQEEGMEVG